MPNTRNCDSGEAQRALLAICNEAKSEEAQDHHRPSGGSGTEPGTSNTEPGTSNLQRGGDADRRPVA